MTAFAVKLTRSEIDALIALVKNQCDEFDRKAHHAPSDGHSEKFWTERGDVLRGAKAQLLAAG